MKPPIRTLSPVWTRRRVEILRKRLIGGTSALAMENSEVLPAGSVAVAMMNWASELASRGKVKSTTPCALVCTSRNPR